MASQKGFTKIRGSLGDTTFLETKNGAQARQKARSIAPQIKSSPAFARTRENNSEFGRACQAAKLIKTALASLVSTAKGSNNSGILIIFFTSIPELLEPFAVLTNGANAVLMSLAAWHARPNSELFSLVRAKAGELLIWGAIDRAFCLAWAPFFVSRKVVSPKVPLIFVKPFCEAMILKF